MRESTTSSFRGKDHCECEREGGWPGEDLQGDDWISSKMYTWCLDLLRQKFCGVLTFSDHNCLEAWLAQNFQNLTWSELSKLSTKDAGPLVPSVSGPSMLNLKCPAFLKIFITDLQYGRKLGKWEQCHVKTEGWGSSVWFFSQNNEVLPGCPLNVLTTPCWTTGGRSASQGRTAPSRWSRASSRWTEPARARWRWGRSTFVVGTAYYSIKVKFYHIFLQTYS